MSSDDPDIDGGRAWITVVVLFISMVMLGGTNYGFGVFMAPLLAEFPDAGNSAIALVGTLMTAMFLIIGPFSGRLSDKYGSSPCIGVGGLLITAGKLWASYSGGYYQLLVSQGILCGIGYGFVAIPVISAVGNRFVKHRGVANGCGVSGAGVGTSVFAIVNQALIDVFGWRAAIRFDMIWNAVAIFGSVLLLQIPGVGMKSRSHCRIHVKKTGPLCDFAMLKNFNFVLMIVVNLISSFGYLVPFLFLVKSGLHVGLNNIEAASLMVVVGIASTVARAIIGWIADALVGRMRAFYLSMSIMGISTIFWGFIENPTLLFVYAGIFGTFSGSMVAMIPPTMADLFGVDDLGSHVGMMNFAASFGAVLGPTLAGLMLDANGGSSFILPSVVSGALMTLTGPILWLVGHRSPNADFGGWKRRNVATQPLHPLDIEIK